MNAEWISAATQAGIEKGEAEAIRKQQLAAARTTVDAEPFTHGGLASYLEPYREPLGEIIDELLEDGFTVETVGPDFLRDSETSAKRGEEFRARYALAEERMGSLGKEHCDNYVFGIGWRIGRKIEDPVRGTKEVTLGRIHLYPVADLAAGTHFGGVEFSTQGLGDKKRGKRRIVTHVLELSPTEKPSEKPSMAMLIRKAIGGWISAFEVQQRAQPKAASAR